MKPLFVLLFISFLTGTTTAQTPPPPDTTGYAYLRIMIRDETLLLKFDSGNISHYLARGYYRMQMQDYAASIDDNTHAILLDPKNSDAYSNRGMARCFMKKYDEAKSDLTKAIRLDPADPMGYLNRAYAETESGDDHKGITDLDTAIKLKPDYAKAYCNRGMAKRRLRQFKAASRISARPSATTRPIPRPTTTAQGHTPTSTISTWQGRIMTRLSA
jgi:tetratricopeptide (TPR) repeat protein